MTNEIKEIIAPLFTAGVSWGIAWGAMRAKAKAFADQFAKHELDNEKRFAENQARINEVKCDYDRLVVDNASRLARIEEGLDMLLKKEGLK